MMDVRLLRRFARHQHHPRHPALDEMMKCHYCGMTDFDDDKFCEACGEDWEEASAAMVGAGTDLFSPSSDGGSRRGDATADGGGAGGGGLNGRR